MCNIKIALLDLQHAPITGGYYSRFITVAPSALASRERITRFDWSCGQSSQSDAVWQRTATRGRGPFQRQSCQCTRSCRVRLVCKERSFQGAFRRADIRGRNREQSRISLESTIFPQSFLLAVDFTFRSTNAFPRADYSCGRRRAGNATPRERFRAAACATERTFVNVP